MRNDFEHFVASPTADLRNVPYETRAVCPRERRSPAKKLMQLIFMNSNLTARINLERSCSSELLSDYFLA